MKSKKQPIITALMFVFIFVASCGTFNKVVTLSPKTGKFPAKKNKIVTVLKRIPINADTLKTLIIVPNDSYWIEMIKNIQYFNRVVTFGEFQKEIISSSLTDKIPSVSDRIGLNKASKHFSPFVVLNMTKEHKAGQGWYAGLTLYEPSRAEIIYQNEIKLNLMWDGWTDQGTMYPLFNSLIDYLNEQK